MSCLYLISESEKGPVKIGVAKNPLDRISELQVGNPKRLRLTGAWSMWTRSDAFDMERAVLEDVAPRRLVGEWVDADESTMRAIVVRRMEEMYPS